MNWHNVVVIAKKDWVEVRQNKYALIPMLILPAVFLVILPLIFTTILPALTVDPQDVLSSDADLSDFIDSMPVQLKSYIDLQKPMESMIIVMLGYMFAPMFLIMPLMYATTIASESFAGERERKTIEALLYTPASDAELFTGKVLASAIPAIGISWAGFIIYTVILNLAPYAYFQRIWFPLPTWWPLIFWITPALVVLGIALSVIISAKVQNFLGAYQTSSATVLFVVLLFAGQLSGLLYLSIGVEMALGALFWLIAFFLGRSAIKKFNRHALLVGK